MYVVLYQFQVKEGREADFRRHWNTLTQAMLVETKSVGARLHAGEHSVFVAYVQWPSKESYEGQKDLSKAAVEARTAMLESCSDIRGIQTMELIEEHKVN